MKNERKNTREDEDILGKSDRNRNNWFHSRTSGIECARNGSSRCPSACIARETPTEPTRTSINAALQLPYRLSVFFSLLFNQRKSSTLKKIILILCKYSVIQIPYYATILYSKKNLQSFEISSDIRVKTICIETPVGSESSTRDKEVRITGRNRGNEYPNLTQVDLRTWICDRVRCRVFNGTAKKVKQKAGGPAQVALAFSTKKNASRKLVHPTSNRGCSLVDSSNPLKGNSCKRSYVSFLKKKKLF